MIKRYFNAAILYAALALACGVFYREFTKYTGFAGQTNLSVLHAHYFVLGMFFFLVLALLEKSFQFSNGRSVNVWILTYHIGLNITAAGLLLRGLAQATGAALSAGMEASLSGVSGIGHIMLGTGVIALLVLARKRAAEPGN